MERWSSIWMTARGNRAVLIITAYQPCDVRGTPKGKFTVHAQQTSILREKFMDNPKPNPQKYFWKSLKAKGDNLIVIGDFNEVLGNNPSGMSKS